MIEFPRDGTAGNGVEAEKTVDILLRLASSARMYRSPDGRLHAQVPVGDRLEMYGLKSAGFRDWLIDGYFSYRGEPASPWAIRRVVSVLEARARFDGRMPSVFIRVGHDGHSPHDGSTYFLDLGDSSGRAIHIKADGWSLIDRPDVHFRRPEGLLPLPPPATDGSINLLRPYVNLNDVDFRLMVAWLTAALRPVGPYPILVLQGEQGSSKSTLARILRLLIDPQVCPLLAEPKSTRDLLVTALNGWLLAYDNISAIPDWMSDALCQLVFGGGFSGRALYSNDERNVIHAQRPVMLNGIEDFVRRGDLRDRCVFLQLPPILSANRRAENEFWRSFEADYPRILGGVLDLIVGAVRALPSVHCPDLPRMADYARWGVALDNGLNSPSETFLAEYHANRLNATASELEDSAIGTAILVAVSRVRRWVGTPAALYEALTEIVGKKVAASAGWPKSPRSFSNELRRITPQLRLNGLSIDFERSHNGRRIVMTNTNFAQKSQYAD
jgi:hypothetical protein